MLRTSRNPSPRFLEAILGLPGTLVQNELRTRGRVRMPPLALLPKWALLPPAGLSASERQIQHSRANSPNISSVAKALPRLGERPFLSETLSARCW